MDRQTIHSVMKSSKGDFKEAVRNLRILHPEATEQSIRDFVQQDAVLNPIWGDHIFDNLKESLTPVTDQSITRDLLEKETRYIAARGLENCGIKGKTLQKLSSYADFVNKSFDTLVDISHGMSLANAVQMQEQAEYIQKNYLMNEQTITRKRLVDGNMEEVEEPLVSAKEKMKWQAEYTSLMNTLLKFASFTTDAKLTGAKINKMMSEAKQDSGGVRKPKRLKPLSPATNSRNKPRSYVGEDELEIIENELS